MKDIVIPVRVGEDNESLRYCLRSIEKNLPHRNIIIAGYCPKWLKNVVHIPADPRHEINKYKRVSHNILAAAASDEVSDWFILFNDDMFVMNPMEEIPMTHRGNMITLITSEAIRSAPQMKESLLMTYNALTHAGIKEPLNYEMHAPMIMNRHALLDLLPILETMKLKGVPIQFRSFYGNMHHVGGQEHADVKLANPHIFKMWTDFPIVSTTDDTFRSGRAGEEIRESFPAKCSYEV